MRDYSSTIHSLGQANAASVVARQEVPKALDLAGCSQKLAIETVVLPGSRLQNNEPDCGTFVINAAEGWVQGMS